jgi:hypothetical protein
MGFSKCPAIFQCHIKVHHSRPIEEAPCSRPKVPQIRQTRDRPGIRLAHILDLHHILGLETFRAFRNGEFNCVSFTERLVTGGLYCGMEDQDVIPRYL